MMTANTEKNQARAPGTASGGSKATDLDHGQAAVVAFLEDPANHQPGTEAVERIDTHAAMVFLAGDLAFKMKRAVAYPYLDFSSLARRKWACHRELELNRRTAPELYLDCLPICRGTDDRLSFGPGGEAVEWVVKMRRFSQSALFDSMARSGELTRDHCRDLADHIAMFHESAEVIGSDTKQAGRAAMDRVVEGNIVELEKHGQIFPAGDVAALAKRSRALLTAVASLLDRRAVSGLVRQCHGDLHLRNICLYEGRPTLFDCIEFNDKIAQIDVLYDLAFLLMDLDEHGLRPEANAVLNRYLQRADGEEGLAALPFFLSQRAAVRAHVSATTHARMDQTDQRAEILAAAQAYFARANAYLAPEVPCLLAVGGFSGSGKTSLARVLAPHLGPSPGAVHLRSDLERKALWNCEELARLPQEAYGPGTSAPVYARLLERTETILKAGHGVVLDAVYAEPEERDAVGALARKLGVGFFGLWLTAPDTVLTGRVTHRSGDASDATAAVVREQLCRGAGSIAWQPLDATPSVDILKVDALRLIDDHLQDDSSDAGKGDRRARA